MVDERGHEGKHVFNLIITDFGGIGKERTDKKGNPTQSALRRKHIQVKGWGMDGDGRIY
jgi:hypothetical protein